jgi:hypothetical protein
LDLKRIKTQLDLQENGKNDNPFGKDEENEQKAQINELSSENESIKFRLETCLLENSTLTQKVLYYISLVLNIICALE